MLKKDGSLVLTDSIKSDKSNSYKLNFILAPNIEAEIKNVVIRVLIKNERPNAIEHLY